MKPGSVIVDMAGEQGGNCELTVPGEAVVRHGVTIIGYTDLVSRLAKQASTLYSTNLLRVTEELCKTKDGVVNVNIEEDAIRGLTVSSRRARHLAGAAAQTACGAAAGQAGGSRTGGGQGPRPRRGRADVGPVAGHRVRRRRPGLCAGGLVCTGQPSCRTSPCSSSACFIGYMVVWNVTPSRCTRR